MATGQRHYGIRVAAFATGWFFVVWIGGVIGAAGVKTVAWLWGGVWPATPVAALLPDELLRFILALPRDSLTGFSLAGLLRLDILTCLLLGPPLLLAPCLLVLVSSRSAADSWRLAAKPFRPAPKRPALPAMHPDLRRKCGFSIAETTTRSTKNRSDAQDDGAAC